jgi:hypothetical protein
VINQHIEKVHVMMEMITHAGDFCIRYPEYDVFCDLINIYSWTVGDDVIEKQREVCDD